ncbi:MBL fold metallo-hydrolase [Halobaculum sp. D14]|uniref:MBL fold metallo-hydrolase n=1 Tax=Halobaculum sp. D14 TaxID=3421642 RepID=UPI003EBBA465
MNRIRLHNTDFEGLNNVYLLDGDDGSGGAAAGDEVVLVDLGVSIPDVRAELVDGLAAHGHDVSDVDRVFLTHWHADHAGLASFVQAESGATLHAHEADAELIAGGEAALREERRRQRDRFVDWGIPEEPRQELDSFLAGHNDLVGDPCDVEPFSDGDTFDVNGRTLEAVHLPGHAAGLSAFADEAAGEAFVGDVILPEYTPNVGGADVRVDAPLSTYVDSLLAVVERDWDVAWPGHRDRIGDPAGRAAEILDHHRERTRRVVDVLDRHGPATPWEVSDRLFGALETIHILHGPGEAYAHLDHLESHGVADRTGSDYDLAVDDPDVDALFPDVDADDDADRSVEH